MYVCISNNFKNRDSEKIRLKLYLMFILMMHFNGTDYAEGFPVRFLQSVIGCILIRCMICVVVISIPKIHVMSDWGECVFVFCMHCTI